MTDCGFHRQRSPNSPSESTSSGKSRELLLDTGCMGRKWSFLCFGDFCHGGSLRAYDWEVSRSGAGTGSGPGRAGPGRAGLCWDTELHCSRNTNLAEMDESTSCNCRNRNLFPVAQSKERIHFMSLFMIFGTKHWRFWFLCSVLQVLAWEASVLLVFQS